MSDYSKPIQKTDDASKEFIMELLEGNETHGVDIDSLYYTDDGWVVIEFLKCDTVDPHKSHPNRYPFNWKKFVTLFELAKKLEGKLILVNYSKEKEWRNHIKIIDVENVNIEQVQNDLNSRKRYSKYIEGKEKEMTFLEFKKWFNALNDRARGPWKRSDVK